jgi:hypothetical protein
MAARSSAPICAAVSKSTISNPHAIQFRLLFVQADQNLTMRLFSMHQITPKRAIGLLHPFRRDHCTSDNHAR